MGILSRLWSKNTESNSYVRRWLGQERAKDDREKSPIFTIFVELIDAVCRFGKENSHDQDRRFQEIAKQYLGDTTLFEIACYTYYRLEAWLADNEPGLKVKLADPIATWIIEVFSVAWRKEEESVGLLFAERLDGYRTMVVSGKTGKEILLEVAQRIADTKGDRFGQYAESSDTESLKDNLQFVKHSLEWYEATGIPAAVEAVRDYCCNQIKQPSSIKKTLNIQEQLEQENRDYLFAMALLEQKDLVKACRAFSRVIDGNSENYNALLQRGQLYVMLGQPLDAIRDFSKAIEVNPDDPKAYLLRGACYHRGLRQGDESLADYSRAIALKPENPAAYYQRGLLYDEITLSREQQASENNDQERDAQVAKGFLAAINEYSQAIALNPDYDDAYVSRGLIYARKAKAEGDAESLTKAIADLEKAMSLNWEHGYLYKKVDELEAWLNQTKNNQQLTTV